MRAVADTSALIDLAIPYAASSISTTGNDDPLKVFLTVYEVVIPGEVEAELGELWVGNEDIVASAAETVLRVSDELATRDPQSVSGTAVPEVPALEPGELHAIHLANHLSPAPAVLVTSEFGKNYDSIIQDRLDPGILCKSTPELLRDLGAKGHMDRRFVSSLLGELMAIKGWDPEYINYLRFTLR